MSQTTAYRTPVASILALVLGLIGLFVASFILSPLALFSRLIALFRGQILLGLLGLAVKQIAPDLLRSQSNLNGQHDLMPAVHSILINRSAG